jgi:hypothetical protein
MGQPDDLEDSPLPDQSSLPPPPLFRTQLRFYLSTGDLSPSQSPLDDGLLFFTLPVIDQNLLLGRVVWELISPHYKQEAPGKRRWILQPSPRTTPSILHLTESPLER